MASKCPCTCSNFKIFSGPSLQFLNPSCICSLLIAYILAVGFSGSLAHCLIVLHHSHQQARVNRNHKKTYKFSIHAALVWPLHLNTKSDLPWNNPIDEDNNPVLCHLGLEAIARAVRPFGPTQMLPYCCEEATKTVQASGLNKMQVRHCKLYLN